MRYRVIKLLDNWLVFWLLVALSIGWTFWLISSAAEATSYTFAGTTGVGTVTGAFQVDFTAPIATNVRGWSNTVYAVSDWQFTATSNWSLLPTTTFHNPGSFEYCVGLCTFSSQTVSTVLTMLDETGGYRLKLTFRPELAPLGSEFERIHTALAQVNTGTLTAHSVPLPGTFWTFLGGMGFLLFRRQLWQITG
jgi:hypothetical protein